MKTIEQLQGESIAAACNECVPIGTECIFVGDLGDQIPTQTRSTAWTLGHGQPVVLIKGRTGGMALERVIPKVTPAALDAIASSAQADVIPEAATLNGWEKKEEFADQCEWNPTENRASYEDENHGPAELIVGANGQWRLCASCAALPEFSRFKKRKHIKR